MSDRITWRWAYGTIAVTQVAVACVLAVARRNWGTDPACSPPAPAALDRQSAERPSGARRRKLAPAVVLTALAFTATETGIESGAGLWGYIFLTAGRGLQRDAAGVAVSAYWATMFLGRVVLGPVAERIGPARLLAGAVAGVPVGTALMAAPGPPILAIIGMMTVGLAAAPIFPLLTLTTARRVGASDVTGTARMASLQVAASALGAAVVPAGLGLAIGAFSARILAPLLLILGLVMGVLRGLLSRSA